MRESPGFPSEPCNGRKKYSSQLSEALEAIGKSARLAAMLKANLDTLASLGKLPIAPHRPDFRKEPWMHLVAYLVEERRLIEFVLGPRVRNQDGALQYIYPSDVCLDCFATSDGGHWRFPDGDLRKKLYSRAQRIHVRLPHFSWTLTKPDQRLDAGTWSTRYLDYVIDGLLQFSEWLETTSRKSLAETLRHSMNPDL